MSYYERIKTLTARVPATLVDFNLPRTRISPPTQATSNFAINREQGDWAEKLIMEAINKTSQHYVAVRYGKSDTLDAGQDGFKEMFQNFQDELDAIGKRPDLLIFKKSEFGDALGYDISRIPHGEITEYVKKAYAGIEIRSSAFLIDRYEATMQLKTTEAIRLALEAKGRILNDFRHLFELASRKKYIALLEGISEETLSITDFRVPSWRSSPELVEVCSLFKILKGAIQDIQKRDFLSITPKVEDIKIVYKWIETFNVPHFYFQVFFDKVYGLSFENILEIISEPNNEDVIFFIGEDTKNQNKTTIKIASRSGIQIAHKVDEPRHLSVRKELDRGRLLFYVTFEGGTAYLDVNNLREVLGIVEGDF